MSAKFITQTPEKEDVKFVTFGELKPNQDATKSYLIKAGESVEGVVTDIKDSPTYTKIFTLKVKGEEKPLLILGKTDLRNKMGYSTDPRVKVPRVVKVNDLVRITFNSVSKTQKGHTWYDFDVAVAE